MTADFSRRAFLRGGASGAAIALGAAVAPARSADSAASPGRAPVVTTRFTVNGEPRSLELDTRVTVLDTLREHLGLTGTKKGCDHGQCGACTVLVGRRRVLSCLTLAAAVEGRASTTIEGARRRGRRTASDAAGLHRPRRVPVRLLHAGPDHVGDRLRRGGPCRNRRRNPRIHERQSLPLRRLSQHRRGDPRRRDRRWRALEH